MNKKLFVILISVAIVLVVATGLTLYGIISFNETNPRANLNVSVMDNYNQPIKDAKITLSDGSAKNSKNNGLAAFKNLRVGSYDLKIEKSGYATIITNAVINVKSNVLSETNIAETNTVHVNLSPLGSTVTGKAVLNINGTQEFAANAEIKLTLTDTKFANRLYSAVTDETGIYKFENLPENAVFSIQGAAVTKDEILYSGSSFDATTSKTWEATTFQANNITYTPAVGQFRIISSTNMNLDYNTSNISIKFSFPVKTELANISVSGGVAERTWSADKKYLSISPVAGTWGDASVITVTLMNNTIRSNTGILLGASGSTTVTAYIEKNSVPEDVRGLRLTGDSDIIAGGSILKITWNAVQNADSYVIYYRNKNDNNYSYLNSNFIPYDTSEPIYDINAYTISAADLDNGDRFEIIVFAKLNGVLSKIAAKLTIYK